MWSEATELVIKLKVIAWNCFGGAFFSHLNCIHFRHQCVESRQDCASARRYELFSVFCSEHLLEWLGIITSSSSYTRRMWVVLIVVFYLSYRLQFARQISPWYIKASCCCSLHSTLTALIALWLGNTHTVHWPRTIQGWCSLCLFNEYGIFSLNM